MAIARPAREFSTLSRADATGFTLAGSGDATVLTPGQYRRGSRHRVLMAGPYAHRSLIERADHLGRLHLACRSARQPRPAGHAGRAGRRRNQRLRDPGRHHPARGAGAASSPVSWLSEHG